MRFVPLIVTLATMSVASVQAQTPTFRSSVTLMSVDVTVLDKDGRPAPGLTADDFRITLNGKVLPVQAVTYVDASPAPASAAASEALPEVTGRRVVSNTVAQPTQHVFVVAVDDMSFPPEGGNRLLRSARRFVDQQPHDVFVGLTTSSGRIVVNPTLDRAAVRDALSQVRGAFHDPRKSSIANAAAIGIVEAIEIVEHNNNAVLDTVLHRECGDAGKSNPAASNNVYANAISIYNEMCASAAKTTARTIASDIRETTPRQVASIARALDALKGARGLKQMLLLSQGIAATRDAAAVVAPITRAAARAGVQLSVIMEDADDVDMSESVHTINDLAATTYVTGVSNRLRDDRAMFRSSLKTLADVAGGTFDLVVGAGDHAFDRAVTAGSAVYRLGIETPSDLSKSKLLELGVSVSRPGLVAHANSQALAEAPALTQSSHDAVDTAMMSGQLHYRVPLRLAVVRRRATSGTNVELGFGLEVSASVKGPLTMTLGVIDQKGVLKKGTRTLPVPRVGANYSLALPMIVDPGLYGLRVAVTDADGNVGSLESNIEARLPPMASASIGALTASDVMTWWTDAADNAQLLALDEVPASVTDLGVGLELYTAPGAPAPAGLTVTMSLSAADSHMFVFNREATLYPGHDMTRAEVSVPMAGLPKGAYVIKASIKIGAQLVGQASAVIRKS